MTSDLLPRFIRFKLAPGYLAMDKNRFNREVRPYVTEIRIGKQGIAFDRLELDAFAEQYKSCNGRPGSKIGEEPWHSTKEVQPGGRVSLPQTDSEYVALLGLKTSSKRRSTRTRSKAELWRQRQLKEKPRRLWQDWGIAQVGSQRIIRQQSWHAWLKQPTMCEQSKDKPELVVLRRVSII